MQQMTWRAPDEVMQQVRAQASAHGRSLNDWVTTVLRAAADPVWSGSEATELRERLARAGLLQTSTRRVRRPPPEEVAAARAAAGRGQLLSDVVAEQRGQ